MDTDEAVLKICLHHCDKFKDFSPTYAVLCLHVINGELGTHAKKSNRDRAVTSYYEVQRNDVDYIMPIMTQPAKIKGQGSPTFIWDETFILNENINHLLKKELNIILFFEIIDLFAFTSKSVSYQTLNQNGIQKAAWAFLKLLGSNGAINTGTKLRLQLYKPHGNRRSPKSATVEEVYSWWSHHPRVSLNASLYVTVERFIPTVTKPVLRSMHPMQKEIGKYSSDQLRNVEESVSSALKSSRKVSADKGEHISEVKWSRKPGEPCKFPGKLLASLETVNSCGFIKFNHSGRQLVAACGSQAQYLLLLYEVPSGNFLLKEVVHSEIIYDLDWSQNDKFILSASGDCSVRLWAVERWCLQAAFIHPSFVYSAKFHPTVNTIIATACFDHIIRIWSSERSVHLLKEFESHNSLVNTLYWYEKGHNLLSADNSGQIKIWKTLASNHLSRSKSVDTWSLEKELYPSEIEGISIVKLIPDPTKSTIYLLCGDHIIRQLDIVSGTVIKRYEFSNSLNYTSGCCSPCGGLLFLSGNDGRIYACNRNSSKVQISCTNILHSGQICCIDYHPHEHMMAVCCQDENVPIYLYINANDEKQIYSPNSKRDCVETSENLTSNMMNDLLLPSSLKNSNENKFTLDSKKKLYPIYSEEVPDTNTEDNKSASKSSLTSGKISSDTGSGYSKFQTNSHREKEILTAVVTKSGQFDVISVRSDNVELDSYSSTKSRKVTSKDDVIGVEKQSSKRSKRRDMMKLEMNKN